MTKKVNKTVEGVEVIDTSAEGLGVARVDEMVVFIEGAVPGDSCTIRIYKQKRKYAFAQLLKIEKPSVNRTTPACIHFGVCGGCKWQNLSYKAQLQFKQKLVADSLERVGKLDLPPINPIMGSNQTYFYRNKLDFSFSNKKWLTKEQIDSEEKFDDRDGLGFHIPKAFDKILDIQECHLQAEPSNAIRNGLRNFAIENDFSFFQIKEKRGLLRTLTIRSTSIGEVMVIVQFFDNDEEKINLTLHYLKSNFPQITSLMYAINQKGNDTFEGIDMICFSGRDYILEEMEGLFFKIGPKTFFQTNSMQAYELYKITREFAGLTGKEFVYDLYTGTGTIASFVARSAAKVIGLEYVVDSVVSAKENARRNGLTNLDFFAGDMKDVLTDEFILKNGKPDVIITDPPRAGMHEDVVNVIKKAAPEKIVYVSCNPGTQARDLQLLSNEYKVTKVQPVDMFPQTQHVENVVLLERK